MAKKAASKATTAMDYPEHVRTYELFLSLTKWGVIAVVVILILLALFFL